jgi:hypothetical protein
LETALDSESAPIRLHLNFLTDFIPEGKNHELNATDNQIFHGMG